MRGTVAGGIDKWSEWRRNHPLSGEPTTFTPEGGWQRPPGGPPGGDGGDWPGHGGGGPGAVEGRRDRPRAARPRQMEAAGAVEAAGARQEAEALAAGRREMTGWETLRRHW